MQALAIQEAPAIQNEDRLVSTVSSLVEVASYLQVTTQEELGNATDVVKLIKTRWKEIEDERTGLVKPLNDTVGKINARFKTILAPLKDAEDAIKAKMLTYQQEEARKAAEARRIAEEAARKAAEEAAKLAAEQSLPVPAPVIIAAPPQPAKSSYGSFGGVSTVKKVWVFEVEDIAALAAARPDLIAVDSAKVNAEIRGKGGNIPGLRIFEKETIAVR